MPGPFPGMDPYLEKPELWPDFHQNLVVFRGEWGMANGAPIRYWLFGIRRAAPSGSRPALRRKTQSGWRSCCTGGERARRRPPVLPKAANRKGTHRARET